MVRVTPVITSVITIKTTTKHVLRAVAMLGVVTTPHITTVATTTNARGRVRAFPLVLSPR